MNRRFLLKLFGLSALVPALPNIPVAAAEHVRPEHMIDLIAAQFQEPLFVDVYKSLRHYSGGVVDHVRSAYVGSIPARVHREADEIVVTFDVDFTGTIEMVVLRNDKNELVYLSGCDMTTPHVTRGNTVRINISLTSV